MGVHRLQIRPPTSSDMVLHSPRVMLSADRSYIAQCFAQVRSEAKAGPSKAADVRSVSVRRAAGRHSASFPELGVSLTTPSISRSRCISYLSHATHTLHLLVLLFHLVGRCTGSQGAVAGSQLVGDALHGSSRTRPHCPDPPIKLNTLGIECWLEVYSCPII